VCRLPCIPKKVPRACVTRCAYLPQSGPLSATRETLALRALQRSFARVAHRVLVSDRGEMTRLAEAGRVASGQMTRSKTNATRPATRPLGSTQRVENELARPARRHRLTFGWSTGPPEHLPIARRPGRSFYVSVAKPSVCRIWAPKSVFRLVFDSRPRLGRAEPESRRFGCHREHVRTGVTLA
jgi:hypothetical protein